MRNLVLSLFLIGAAVGAVAPASPSPAPPALGEHGTASGKWDLPGGGLAGHASGILSDAQGLPVYTLAATLVPKAVGPAGGIAGELKGTLNQLAGPSGSGFSLVRGRWKADPLGLGEFRAVILDPGDPQNGIPPFPIGAIRGKFLDPHGPGTPGKFHGLWKLP